MTLMSLIWHKFTDRSFSIFEFLKKFLHKNHLSHALNHKNNEYYSAWWNRLHKLVPLHPKERLAPFVLLSLIIQRESGWLDG